MKLYLAITPDQYELPLCVEDSPTGLAEALGITVNAVRSACAPGTARRPNPWRSAPDAFCTSSSRAASWSCAGTAEGPRDGGLSRDRGTPLLDGQTALGHRQQIRQPRCLREHTHGIPSLFFHRFDQMSIIPR